MTYGPASLDEHMPAVVTVHVPFFDLEPFTFVVVEHVPARRPVRVLDLDGPLRMTVVRSVHTTLDGGDPVHSVPHMPTVGAVVMVRHHYHSRPVPVVIMTVVRTDMINMMFAYVRHAHG